MRRSGLGRRVALAGDGVTHTLYRREALRRTPISVPRTTDAQCGHVSRVGSRRFAGASLPI
jgi:hypothetical protein